MAANLSKKLHTRVTIKHVDFALFNNMELQGLLIEDQHQDFALAPRQLAQCLQQHVAAFTILNRFKITDRLDRLDRLTV